MQKQKKKIENLLKANFLTEIFIVMFEIMDSVLPFAMHPVPVFKIKAVNTIMHKTKMLFHTMPEG